MSGDHSERSSRRRAERRQHDVIRRRRVALAAVALAALIGGALVGAGGGGDDAPAAEDTAEADPTLPRGGRSLLPGTRMVGFYGAPQDDALGTLGIGTPEEAGERLLDQARAYRGGEPVLPVLELVATIAASAPGDDGKYVLREPDRVIDRYLEEARRIRGLLLLDVQPGRASFPEEIERLLPYLRQPDVGLALDPEWHVGPDEVPGQVIGSVEARDVNLISAELADLVREYDLPEKLFVIHKFTPGMVSGPGRVIDRPGLATIINVDGFGDAPNKIAKYEQLHPSPRSRLGSGFKLFIEEDIGLMTPEQVLDLSPKPDLIVYE
ncbi:MAG TPA: hypothetical protein VD765_04935 [Solirubrobacterales bacterium]|nr:hypothetical protein [Solirubrobacterales bacterium]